MKPYALNGLYILLEWSFMFLIFCLRLGFTTHFNSQASSTNLLDHFAHFTDTIRLSSQNLQENLTIRPQGSTPPSPRGQLEIPRGGFFRADHRIH